MMLLMVQLRYYTRPPSLFVSATPAKQLPMTQLLSVLHRIEVMVQFHGSITPTFNYYTRPPSLFCARGVGTCAVHHGAGAKREMLLESDGRKPKNAKVSAKIEPMTSVSECDKLYHPLNFFS